MYDFPAKIALRIFVIFLLFINFFINFTIFFFFFYLKIFGIFLYEIDQLSPLIMYIFRWHQNNSIVITMDVTHKSNSIKKLPVIFGKSCSSNNIFSGLISSWTIPNLCNQAILQIDSHPRNTYLLTLVLFVGPFLIFEINLNENFDLQVNRLNLFSIIRLLDPRISYNSKRDNKNSNF